MFFKTTHLIILYEMQEVAYPGHVHELLLNHILDTLLCYEILPSPCSLNYTM